MTISLNLKDRIYVNTTVKWLFQLGKQNVRNSGGTFITLLFLSLRISTLFLLFMKIKLSQIFSLRRTKCLCHAITKLRSLKSKISTAFKN